MTASLVFLSLNRAITTGSGVGAEMRDLVFYWKTCRFNYVFDCFSEFCCLWDRHQNIITWCFDTLFTYIQWKLIKIYRVAQKK